MAHERIPRDPADSNPARDPDRYAAASDDTRDPTRLDNELQVDPELAEGHAGRGRITVFAIAIAVILGAVFYGLNSSSSHHAASSPMAPNSAPPPAASAGGGATHANAQPGVTTGAVPAPQPQTPPSSSAATTTEMNHSGNPPSGHAAPANTQPPAK